MKLLSIVLASLACGAAVGYALARANVGEVETAFAPPPGAVEVDAPAVAPGAPVVRSSQLEVEGPIAKVDATVHDFGTMQRGAKASHEFVFTNAGAEPLKLEVGKTSCKCTLGDVQDRPLEPGESTPVRLEWVAKSLPGDFRQVASVLTNDPRHPTIDLTVEGTITELAGLSPKELLFGRVSADGTATAAVYLSTFTDAGAETPLVATAAIDDESPLAGKARVEVIPVDPEELPKEGATSGVRIEMTVGPGLPIGALTDWLTVTTNLHDGAPEGDTPDGETLQVPLIANVEGDISIHGRGWSKQHSVLNLGKVASADGVETNLLVSFKGEHSGSVRAEVASVDPEWLEIDLAEPKAIREGVVHQRMTVRIPPGRPAIIRSGRSADDGGVGAGDALVRLTTTHPTNKEIDFRVRFIVLD